MKICIVDIGVTNELFYEMNKEVQAIPDWEQRLIVESFIDGAVSIDSRTVSGSPCTIMQFGFLDWNKKYPEVAWLLDYLKKQNEENWCLFVMGLDARDGIEIKGNFEEFPISADLYLRTMV